MNTQNIIYTLRTEKFDMHCFDVEDSEFSEQLKELREEIDDDLLLEDGVFVYIFIPKCSEIGYLTIYPYLITEEYLDIALSMYDYITHDLLMHKIIHC